MEDEKLEERFQRLLRSGTYTTEFWLALSAQILGAVVASGILPPEHWASQVVGLIVMVLAGMGYKWSRTTVKAEALRTIATVAASQPVEEKPSLSLGDDS